MPGPVRAYLTAAGMRVVLEAGADEASMWRESFPVWHLPKKIAFYRKLAARKGGRYRAHHQPTVEALEAVQREVSARKNPEEQNDTEGV